MRKSIIAAATLLLVSCIPSGQRDTPRRPPAKVGYPQVQSSAAIRQCLADLGAANVKYSALTDRYFDGGCSALGSVKLLDIGTPVSNLGAMTCPLALTFARWTRESVQPAARAWLGTDVTKVESFGTYSCRSVNGQPGGKLSEHGRANAVDISAFHLADGRRITVLDGWNGADPDVRRFLRAVHQAGCRRFNIGLGPDANSLHRNHFHFDMGAGPYCR